MQFKQDSEVMETISTKQDNANDKTVLETNKLVNENKYAVSGFFDKVFRLIFAVAVFGLMVMFIRFFPNKRFIKA